MNWLDIVILVVWGITALWGFRSGLVQMVVPLLVIIIGLAVASRIVEPVGNIFEPFTDNENAQTVIAIIVIFIGLFILAAWISFIIRTMMRFLIIFGFLDRLAGMLLGILVGFVLLSGALAGVQKYPVRDSTEKINESPLASFLADNFDVVIRSVKLIPGDWDQKFNDLREDVDDRIPDLPGQDN